MNKVETAVRVRHLPTGVMVKCSRERSQAANKVPAGLFKHAPQLPLGCKRSTEVADVRSM